MKTLYNITLPKYMDEKVGLLYVRTPDGDKIHQSWRIVEGRRIIVFESNFGDYPTNALLVFNDLKEYMDEIRNVGWINNLENVFNQSEELTVYGFPY